MQVIFETSNEMLLRRSYFGLQNWPHLLQCIVIFFRSVGGHAIAWNDEMKVAHVGVVGGEQDADIGGHPGQHHRVRLQVVKQRVERRRKERGVLGLENEVVVLVRAAATQRSGGRGNPSPSSAPPGH